MSERPSPESIRALFEPRSVAVVGASPSGFGGTVIQNLVTAGYDGQVAGVNPKYDEVMGKPCFASLDDVPFAPDAVVISVGRERVVTALEDAARAGSQAAVVFAIGFTEADELGSELQERLIDVAQEAGIAVVGPNCQGLLNFAKGSPLYMDVLLPYEPGRVGLVAQSGSIATSLINNVRGVRWSHAVSSGNEAIVTAGDLISYYVDSPDVDVICAFVETIRDPEFFFAQADRAWEAGKPIIVCKTGRTQEAQAAATAHSGALAVPHRLVDAALARHNVIRVQSLEELLETAIAMQSPRPPKGRGVAVLTASGGQIELYHDNVPKGSLETATFTGETQDELRELLAPFLAARNPLDWWGSPGWEEGAVTKIVDCVARDPNVDVVLQVGDFTKWPTGDEMRAQGALDTSREVAATRDELFVVLDAVGGTPPREFVEAGLADDTLVLSGYETGLRALAHLVDYHLRRTGTVPRSLAGDSDLQLPFGDGTAPTELLAAAGFDVARSVVLDADEALDGIAGELGFPVVAKIGDEDVVHKTERGGVVVGIESSDELAAAVERLKAAGASTVLVQEQIRGGVEVFLGLQTAAGLGTFLVVGLGGIWTEVLDDVQIRPVGITREEAGELLHGLRAYPLLSGGRGTSAVDTERLVTAIMQLDALGAALGDRVLSVDINPLIVTADRAVVVDAVVIPNEPATVPG
jgi:acetate---CoA ligase (ADP-forming)